MIQISILRSKYGRGAEGGRDDKRREEGGCSTEEGIV